MSINQNSNIFFQGDAFEKCLQNGGHFVQASIWQLINISQIDLLHLLTIMWLCCQENMQYVMWITYIFVNFLYMYVQGWF